MDDTGGKELQQAVLYHHNGTSEPASATMIEVATYNVHKWSGVGGRKYNPELAAAVLEELDADIIAFSAESGDTLTMALQNLNVTLRRLNQNLASLESTTASLDTIITSVNQGEGTLGLLVNDPALYNRLDSVSTNLNRLIQSFEENPARYLREMRLIDIF